LLWSGRQFVQRDMVGEEGIIRELVGMGFKLSVDRDVWEFSLLSVEGIWNFLYGYIGGIGNGGEVYFERDCLEMGRGDGGLKLEISRGTEDGDRFAICCCLFGNDGVVISWDEIFSQVRGGKCFVRDGRMVYRFSVEQFRVLRFVCRRAIIRDGDCFWLGIYSALSLADMVMPFWRGDRANWLDFRKGLVVDGCLPEVVVSPLVDGLLRDYQREGIAWIRFLGECGVHGILADEMGLGKTLQALAVVDLYGRNGGREPSLVVCPTSLLENWRMEAKKFFPEMRVAVIRGKGREGIIAGMDKFQLLITSYALLRRDIDCYEGRGFGYLVLDEAQHIKNPVSATACTCKRLISRHRLILTGTPIENSLSEVWSLFDFLLPGLLGTHGEFCDMYERFRNQKECNEKAELLSFMIRPFILRRIKSEVCKQLPPKMEQVVYCELNAIQRKLYNAILRDGCRLLEGCGDSGFGKGQFKILATLLRLRQVCCHPKLLPKELVGDGLVLSSLKLELLQEIILEAIDAKHRILVFSQFTSMLDLIVPWLVDNGIRYERLDGSSKNRQAKVNRFNNDDSIPIFLLSLKAGGTGLNLTGADMVVHYDQWWNPMVEDQATDRTHRIGQVNTVTSIKLVVRNSIEERVLELQANKREIFDKLLAGVPCRLGELTREDIEYLLQQEY